MLKPGAIVQGRVAAYRVENYLAKGGQVIAWYGRSLSARPLEVVIREPRPDLPRHLYDLQVHRLREAYYILYTLYNLLRNLGAGSAGLQGQWPFEMPVDYADDGKTFYMVTNFIRGRVLSSLAPCERSLGGPACGEVAQRLIAAVLMMHMAGVIHRDIKPRNIILRDAPRTPVLIDFTTAKYFYRITLREVIVRSPGGYTAPEQESGELVSTQSDMWSLGATLYNLFTAKKPAVVAAGGAPPPVHRLVEDGVPLPLAAFTSACLNRDPARRPAGHEDTEALLMSQNYVTPSAELVILGKKFSIDGSRAIIGRSGDIRIDTRLDPNVFISESHAAIYYRAGVGWVIRDLCSKNGTAVWKPGLGLRFSWPGRAAKGENSCRPGTPVGDEIPLGDAAMIILGYNSRLGPYLTAVFRRDRLRLLPW